jgi:hypothetical protein
MICLSFLGKQEEFIPMSITKQQTTQNRAGQICSSFSFVLCKINSGLAYPSGGNYSVDQAQELLGKDTLKMSADIKHRQKNWLGIDPKPTNQMNFLLYELEQ